MNDMFESWTFGKKIGAGFALAALTMVVVAWFGYQGVHRLIENDRWVNHTNQVRVEIASVLSSLEQAESGQRGFIVTGHDSYLNPYRRALPDIEKRLAEIRRLTSDNPNQQRRLDALRPVLERRLATLKAVLDVRHSDGLESAATAMTEGPGARTMDEARRALAEMDAEELELLGKRREEAEVSSQAAKSGIWWGGALGIVFISVMGFFIARSLANQIGAAVKHVQSSSAELQAAANQQATGAREQATAMSEISTTISELLATSRQIAESSQRVAQIAEQTARETRAGDNTVAKGNDAIAGIRKQVDAVVAHMLELGKKSQQIGGGARDRLRARGADQHPRDQRDHRGRGGRRGGQALRRGGRRDSQAGRPRGGCDQRDPHADR